MSPENRSFSAPTSSARSPRSTVVLFHSGFSSVVETTNFGMALNFFPNSPVPSIVGHAFAKPS